MVERQFSRHLSEESRLLVMSSPPKQIILEELRINPNLASKDLRKIMERIRGVEADHNAEVNNKNNIRKVGEFKCKKTHSRGECTYVCKICKKKGHSEDRCWQREDAEKGRSDSKDRWVKDKTKSSKSKRSPFKKGVKVVNQSDQQRLSPDPLG